MDRTARGKDTPGRGRLGGTAWGLMVVIALGCGDAVVGAAGTLDAGATRGDGPAVDADIGDASPVPRPVPARQVTVIHTLLMAREDAPGVSEGIDLDGETTPPGGTTGCGQRDFTATDGRPGIDNQFGLLIPLIEAAGGEAFGPYIQGSINDGKFLVMVELDGMDDLADDDDVTLTLYRGLGTPYVGANARLEPWQTFDIDPDGVYSRVEGVQIINGIVEAGPFEMRLPFYIFDFVFELDIHDAQIRLQVGSDGRHTGVLAGAVAIENILSIADDIEGGAQIYTLLETLADSYADLLPDAAGVCQALSATMAFETVGAFFYEDAPRPQ